MLNNINRRGAKKINFLVTDVYKNYICKMNDLWVISY